MTMSEQKPHRRRGNRTRWIIVAAVVVVVLGTAAAVGATQVTEAQNPPQPPSPAATANITKTDLSDQETADGTVGFGTETELNGRKPGTITVLPKIGAVIKRGEQVYGVDANPVVLFIGILPFYRDLAAGVTDGPDVKELEENLKALGFSDFGTPDNKFTSATAAALKKWQKSLGLPQTGTFAPGDVVLASDSIRISTLTGQLGGLAQGPIAKVTGTNRVVEVKLDVSKQNLAKVGDKVTVDVNGGSTAGKVIDVGSATVGKDPQGNPGKSTVTVTIALDNPDAAGSVANAPATVHFVKEVHAGVLVVPVGALLALREGGYAVQIVENGQKRLVAVKTGLFANGQVEISGDGLKAGMKVVTTS
jgi:peptidoglycan hydrolase-like protein with peptidoglycan-binding domain